ncbi:hypothetical protein [Caproiciproducens galactitolivorans]|uniref:hypothetical protein n=1 Tax=Caproiciproducens galactitolivorans TaxID=642589 RepID=UPI00240A5A40|nr:hypothetical protein [Caproiciproducens galactitolivorans]
MKRLWNQKRIGTLLALVVGIFAAFHFAVPVSAGEEIAASNLILGSITLKENSSYVSEEYAGVINLNVKNTDIVCASIDSQNRVVITAVGSGSTTVSYWCRHSVSEGWVNTIVPVTVSGQSSSAATVNADEAGVVFAQQNVNVGRGASYTANDIKVNGISTGAANLLWVSSSDAVASVNKTTGEIQGVSAGTATVYAIDPNTKYCGYLNVTVS